MPKDKDRNRQQQHGYKQSQDDAMRKRQDETQRQDETMRQQQNRGHLSPERSQSSQLSDEDKDRSRQFERQDSDR
jgi:hypothetical protein